MVWSPSETKTSAGRYTTSRDLHSDCGKYIFQDAVTLQGDRAIVSFIQFMRPYNLQRWRHLDTLCLSHEPISPLVAEEFSKLIPYVSCLRYLEMLEAMHWPLESAALRHTTFKPGLPDQDLLDRMHPATLLKNARATLKHLDCHDWGGRTPFLHICPVYPKLESLSVTSVPCPRAVQWAVSYPALKWVSVQTFTTSRALVDMDEALLADQMTARLLNMNELATQGQPWGELERLHATVLDLYLLGFTCRIRELWLDISIHTSPFFAPVMATARPTDLALSMCIGLIHPPPTYLRDPSLTDMKILTLDITVWVDGSNGNEEDVDIESFLGHVLDLLRRASVRKFALYLTIQRAIGNSDEAVPLFAAETWAKDTDLEALAQHFLEEVASLELIELDTRVSASSIGRPVELSRVPLQDSGIPAGIVVSSVS
ncbi:hypothetical protein V8D89_006880 [Ganoderma adspersum]